jgi:hypothetical protein
MKGAGHELFSHVGDTLANGSGYATVLRSIDRVASLPFVPTSYRTRCRVSGDSLLPHQPCEVLAPGTQHCLVDVQPLPVFAFGFDDHMDVWVLLVGVQDHRVSML